MRFPCTTARLGRKMYNDVTTLHVVDPFYRIYAAVKPDLAGNWLKDEQNGVAEGEDRGEREEGRGAFSNRAPIFFEQRPRLSLARRQCAADSIKPQQ